MLCKQIFFLPCCVTLLDGILICLAKLSQDQFSANLCLSILQFHHCTFLKQDSDLFFCTGIKFCNCRFFLCISFGLLMRKHIAGIPGGKSSGLHPRHCTLSQQLVGFLLLEHSPAFPCSIMQMKMNGHRDEFGSLL